MSDSESIGEDVADKPFDVQKLRGEPTEPPPPSFRRRQSRSILDFFSEGVDTTDSGGFNDDVSLTDYSPDLTGRKVKPDTATLRNFKYNMNHEQRGLFLIFNHQKFKMERAKERSGTTADLNNLKETAEYLGFQVEHFNDLRKKDIQQVVNHYAKEKDHSNYDCFACAVLTHGEYGDEVYAKDKTYHLSMIMEPFRDCPSLRGKPKLFFVQACRGKQKDQGVGIDQADGIQKLPTEADCFIGYSTVEGYLAWRNEEDGSWYIQALCRCLKQYHSEKDFLQIMTIVHKMVAYDCETNDCAKQMPCMVSKLTGEVHFKYKMECVPDGNTLAMASNIESQECSSKTTMEPIKAGMQSSQSELKQEVYKIKLELNNMKRQELGLKLKLRELKETLYQHELKSLQE